MTRRLAAFAAASALVATQLGCFTSRCGSRPGLFTSHARQAAPCQTVGLTGGCFDAATGQPCPCPPEAAGVLPGGPMPAPPGTLIPGPGLPTPDQLHMPAPSDMIRPPAPAIPLPAPGDASLPFPASAGTPVKAGPNR